MIKTATFTANHNNLKIGDVFEFRPGVNLIVGDQGSGKSSLLGAIAVETKAPNCASGKSAVKLEISGPFRPLFFDFEKHNPRIQPAFGMVQGISDKSQINAMFISHGEMAKGLFGPISNLPQIALALLDEPDGALSPRSCYALAEVLKNSKAMQTIASVHNPILIESQPEVFSMEHRRWMTSTAFMETQRSPRGDR